MPITRNSAVMDMDTRQELRMIAPNQRFTRAQAHRLLKINKVEHDASGTMEYMMLMIRMHNVPLTMPTPGIIEIAVPKPPPQSWMDELAEDGYPRQIGKLKGLCKTRGIKYHPKAKRVDLVKMLDAG